MPTSRTELIHGRKRPYSTWTFIRVQESVRAQLEGTGRLPVTCTLRRSTFRATLSPSEGDFGIHLKKERLEELEVAAGDREQVKLELNTQPCTFELHAELLDLFSADPERESIYEALSPSLRRAWPQHVDEAKRPDIRKRLSPNQSA